MGDSLHAIPNTHDLLRDPEYLHAWRVQVLRISQKVMRVGDYVQRVADQSCITTRTGRIKSPEKCESPLHANAHVPHSLGGCQKPLSISPACGWSSSTPPIPTSASAAT